MRFFLARRPLYTGRNKVVARRIHYFKRSFNRTDYLLRPEL